MLISVKMAFEGAGSYLLLTPAHLLVFWFIEAIGQTIFATIMSVKVADHKKLQHYIHLKSTSSSSY